MSRTDERVNQGGLMRCCLATLADDIEEDRPEHTPTEGEVLPCKYCRSSMIHKAGVWLWNREKG